MIVYQTDYEGFYIGETEADIDPLDESNLLIPAGCVLETPPELLENQVAKWDGSAWSVITIVEDVLVEEPEVVLTKEEEMRMQRHMLLSQTDWWAVSDRTMTPDQSAYRQALRDITAQPGFPDDVVWPTKPE